jgi:hypothetical protein
MSLYTSTYQFQGVQGPTDPMLTHNAVEGYQPVSRIGEVVINAFGTLQLIRHQFQSLSALLC